MRLESDVKLDFKDVLIRPKRSTLTTRSDVDISREFRFRHTGAAYAGIPIVASNMDATGTFEMARALAAFKLSTALHKYYGTVWAPYLCEYQGEFYIYFPAAGHIHVTHASTPVGP